MSKTIPVAKKKRERKSPCLTFEQNAKRQKSSEPPSCEQMNLTAPANKAIERAGNPEVPVPSKNPISSDDESMGSKSDIENEEIEDPIEHQAVKEIEDEMEVQSTGEEIDRKVKPKKARLSQTQYILRDQNPHKQDDRRLKRYPNLKR
ncbi:uncharacterized protein LOC119728079 [Patiria miniata]|uniref:Uncharacterized protein n=1 Tax=Patiria miniata TaxID=46514 RepID=A0A913ZWU3_PATMI|nr:uncharacterized protein LOC119728079 [Patiria miniata]